MTSQGPVHSEAKRFCPRCGALLERAPDLRIQYRESQAEPGGKRRLTRLAVLGRFKCRHCRAWGEFPLWEIPPRGWNHELPTIPSYYDDPPTLAQALYAAIDQQDRAERALRGVLTYPDSSLEDLAQKCKAEIVALLAGKALEAAIDNLSDWVDELEG